MVSFFVFSPKKASKLCSLKNINVNYTHRLIYRQRPLRLRSFASPFLYHTSNNVCGMNHRDAAWNELNPNNHRNGSWSSWPLQEEPSCRRRGINAQETNKRWPMRVLCEELERAPRAGWLLGPAAGPGAPPSRSSPRALRRCRLNSFEAPIVEGNCDGRMWPRIVFDCNGDINRGDCRLLLNQCLKCRIDPARMLEWLGHFY